MSPTSESAGRDFSEVIILALVVVFAFFVLLIMSLRLWVRMKNKNTGWDDWMMLAATVSTCSVEWYKRTALLSYEFSKFASIFRHFHLSSHPDLPSHPHPPSHPVVDLATVVEDEEYFAVSEMPSMSPYYCTARPAISNI